MFSGRIGAQNNGRSQKRRVLRCICGLGNDDLPFAGPSRRWCAAGREGMESAAGDIFKVSTLGAIPLPLGSARCLTRTFRRSFFLSPGFAYSRF